MNIVTQKQEYKGKTYFRNNAKWVDADHFVVPEYLQNILNTLVFDDKALENMSYREAVDEGDKYKLSETYPLAIRYYEHALKITDNISQASVVLPRVTSCYRKLGQPGKVVEILSDAKAAYGENVINMALLTSVAAAYCDLGQPENAIRCCKWAYRVLKVNLEDRSFELTSVYERANKMLDKEYDRDEFFNERDRLHFDK